MDLDNKEFTICGIPWIVHIRDYGFFGQGAGLGRTRYTEQEILLFEGTKIVIGDTEEYNPIPISGIAYVFFHEFYHVIGYYIGEEHSEEDCDFFASVVTHLIVNKLHSVYKAIKYAIHKMVKLNDHSSKIAGKYEFVIDTINLNNIKENLRSMLNVI